MYYSFKCTYCGRNFYTFDDNKERASITLYRTVKQHLIDYNEDHKEHEMDDGEQADSNQIYNELIESNVKPGDGYEATQTAPVNSEGSTTSVSSSTSHSSITTLLILLLFLAFVGLLFLFPGILQIFKP